MSKVFALTIFLAAFLVFEVQLILGKFILPWFGGSPAVWSTCMLFFQTVLLLGYAYAYFLTRKFSPPWQVRIHVLLLGGCLLLIGTTSLIGGSPILPGNGMKPLNPEQPIWQIVKLLLSTVGLPFFTLTATSPLLQHWCGLVNRNQNSYRLFALSNLGAAAGLLAYPFIIEPAIGLVAQAWLWGTLFVGFAVACTLAAGFAFTATEGPGPTPTTSEIGTAPPIRIMILWGVLAAVASSMFLSVTNAISQNVAAIPLLWILPLGVYLLSLVVCFYHDRCYARNGFIILSFILGVIGMDGAFASFNWKWSEQLIFYSVFLFGICMVCHGELVRIRPDSRYLTGYYLIVAAGGAAGGVFVGVIAPLLFNGFWELPLTVAVAWLATAWALGEDSRSPAHMGSRLIFAFGVWLATRQLVQPALGFTPLRHWDAYWRHTELAANATAILLSMIIVGLTRRGAFARSKWWPRCLLGLALLLSIRFTIAEMKTAPGIMMQTRNFYGVLKVRQQEFRARTNSFQCLELSHGQVNHGIQFFAPELRTEPVAYYGKGSGIELAFRLLPRRNKAVPIRIGVLGLGIGTLAAFTHPNDTIRFYEINPQVHSFAAGPHAYFTYLSNSAGAVEIVLGDARLSLERELATGDSQQFDILVLDAFAGDSVPVHLLTREAFQTYRQHLRDADSVIAVNVSNRFLDLRDVICGVAREFDLTMVVINSAGQPPEHIRSRWCLLTRNSTWTRSESLGQADSRYQPRHRVLWTDNFSSLAHLWRE